MSEYLNIEDWVELKHKIMEILHRKKYGVFISHDRGACSENSIAVPEHVDIKLLCSQLVADSKGVLDFKMFPASYTHTVDVYELKSGAKTIGEKYKALLAQVKSSQDLTQLKYEILEEYLKLQTSLGEKFEGMYIAHDTTLGKHHDNTLIIPSHIHLETVASEIRKDSEGSICFHLYPYSKDGQLCKLVPKI